MLTIASLFAVIQIAFGFVGTGLTVATATSAAFAAALTFSAVAPTRGARAIAATATVALAAALLVADPVIDELLDLLPGELGRGRIVGHLGHVVNVDVHHRDREHDGFTELLAVLAVSHPLLADHEIAAASEVVVHPESGRRVDDVLAEVGEVDVDLLLAHPLAFRVELEAGDVVGHHLEVDLPLPLEVGRLLRVIRIGDLDLVAFGDELELLLLAVFMDQRVQRLGGG